LHLIFIYQLALHTHTDTVIDAHCVFWYKYNDDINSQLLTQTCVLLCCTKPYF